jgi:hypothetical protein
MRGCSWRFGARTGIRRVWGRRKKEGLKNIGTSLSPHHKRHKPRSALIPKRKQAVCSRTTSTRTATAARKVGRRDSTLQELYFGFYSPLVSLTPRRSLGAERGSKPSVDLPRNVTSCPPLSVSREGGGALTLFVGCDGDRGRKHRENGPLRDAHTG